MAKPYIVTISSEKGGVGKTTLATNLAIYLKRLTKEVPVTLLSFDNHFTVDRMFLSSPRKKSFHVGHLFTGGSATELITEGEYGVQIIPSCSNLHSSQSPVTDVTLLADNLSRSQLKGIVIIDTSPVLDIFTRNALYAADRVIVPVKDAPSLENCKNLSRFFVTHDLPKSTLRLLPCLIDTRIRYKGPFRDPYQLIKAYAINRGFRCMEGYIAKSPKVESLNTNPEGRVYPIITHGKSTDVHLQFTHLARQVYLEYLEHGPSRMGEIAEMMTDLTLRQEQELFQRRQRLTRHCLYCDKEIPDTGPWPYSFYVESTNASLSGFIEEQCFLDLVFRNFYGQHKGIGVQDTMLDLFRDSASRSYFSLHQLVSEDNQESHVDFCRLDETGGELSSKRISVKDGGNGLLRRGIHPVRDFLDRTFNGPLQSGDRSLLFRRTGEQPLTILTGAAYARWQTVITRTLLERSSQMERPVLL